MCIRLIVLAEFHGLSRALTYMVQTLSAEPGFGLQLSLPVKVQLPTKWNLLGTTADFMVTVGCFSYCDGVMCSNSPVTSQFIH